ncbi:MAG TPA: nuclear transport factor 2 family protein [Longimicrobiales bacterium]
MNRTAAVFRPRGLARAAALVGLAVLTACDARAGSSADSERALADTLRARIAQAYDFTHPDVVDRMMSLYPDSGRVVSASGGYIMTTPDSLRQGLADFWANVGENMQNPVWRWDDVYVDRLSRDAAVMTGTWSIAHIAPTGRPHTIRGAWTAAFRRIDGEWMIVQEHLSVPPVAQ